MYKENEVFRQKFFDSFFQERIYLFLFKELIKIKILLTALNAKFIHSSLALRSIKKYCSEFEKYIYIEEFTINNSTDFIISEIYKQKPDVLGFSCYIWNINMILEIIDDIKKILPSVKIVLGGPEVSFEYNYLFDIGADIICIGEGEQTFYELSEYFIQGKKRINDIDGIAYRCLDKIVINKLRKPVQLDTIPFVYYDCIDELENKIIYYESSRGCPYNCQYCLSSVEKGVRFLSEERVLNDLEFFIDNKVRQVKFVDRTFNCNKNYAMMIWKYLIDNDNGITNFHFEISADILDTDMLELLSQARPLLFQLEIGVQSTNLLTLDFIKRKTDLSLLFEKVKKIKSFKNIHQHLDLIAGLPGENYQSFKKSFNDVYSLYPEQLQLGFLKLLKGSGLREAANYYGIVYKGKAPYEVLYTKEISFAEMQKLKLVEEIVEIYYNSSKAVYTLRYIVAFFSSPFDFFELLADYWENNEYHKVSHNKMNLYTILYEFCSKYVNDDFCLKQILKFDIFLNDNVKSFPYWLDYDDSDEIKRIRKEFFNDKTNILNYIYDLKDYEPRQLNRMCRLEKFDIDLNKWILSDYSIIDDNECFILFNYYDNANINGNVKFTAVI